MKYTSIAEWRQDHYQNDFDSIIRWKQFVIDQEFSKAILIDTEVWEPIVKYKDGKFFILQTSINWIERGIDDIEILAKSKTIAETTRETFDANWDIIEKEIDK